MLLHEAPEFRQNAAADQMSMGVIDPLEVIQIQKHQGKLCLITPGPVGFPLQQFMEVVGVEQTGQFIRIPVRSSS